MRLDGFGIFVTADPEGELVEIGPFTEKVGGNG